MQRDQLDGMNEATRVISAKHQMSCQLDEDAVILNLDSGTYYGMSPIGARIWELLKQERSIAAIRDQIAAEYEVSSEQCLTDVIDLLRELIDAGLVVVVQGSGPDA